MAICTALDLACVNVVLLVWVDICALFNILRFYSFPFSLVICSVGIISSARKPLKTRKHKQADFFLMFSTLSIPTFSALFLSYNFPL